MLLFEATTAPLSGAKQTVQLFSSDGVLRGSNRRLKVLQGKNAMSVCCERNRRAGQTEDSVQ